MVPKYIYNSLYTLFKNSSILSSLYFSVFKIERGIKYSYFLEVALFLHTKFLVTSLNAKTLMSSLKALLILYFTLLKSICSLKVVLFILPLLFT